MFTKREPLLRPTQYVEESLVVAILNGTWPPGTALPAERLLAEELGVTRPTLREALQRLAKDRWVTICHGKATVVNNYWQQGGLGILSTLAAHTDYLPPEFVGHLLEARIAFMPVCAQAAAISQPQTLISFLEKAVALGESSQVLAAYDWELQLLLVRQSGNLIYPLILNDFAPVFELIGQYYFKLPDARQSSLNYYAKLQEVIAGNGDVEQTVRQVMTESLGIWQQN